LLGSIMGPDGPCTDRADAEGCCHPEKVLVDCKRQ
jgi:hypothetical protein